MNETLYDYILNYEGISNWISSILFTLLQTFEGLNVPFKRTCFIPGACPGKGEGGASRLDLNVVPIPLGWTILDYLQHLSDVIIT